MTEHPEVDRYVGRKLTYQLKSGFLGEVIVRSDCKNHPPRIEDGVLHFISPEGFRSIRIENVTKISRKRY